MRWLKWLGLEERLQAARRLASEMAEAAEDRLALFSIEWLEEKERLQRLLVSALLVVVLSVVLLLVLSLALVAQFWDSPERMTAIWGLVLIWSAAWSFAVWVLFRALRQGRHAFASTRQELARDWAELKDEL